MSTPHKCPVCDGRGKRQDDSTECAACKGSGVVWEPSAAKTVEHHYHYHFNDNPSYINVPWTLTTHGTATDIDTSIFATNAPSATVTCFDPDETSWSYT